MSLQSDFNKGFHGQIPAHLKTKQEDAPRSKRQKKSKNIIEGKAK